MASQKKYHSSDLLDHYRTQLSNFQKEDEQRRQYEKEELQRQQKLLGDLHHSDEEAREEMRRMGVDVDYLLKQDNKAEKHFEKVREKLQEIKAPPEKSSFRDPILFRTVAAFSHRNEDIYPPAFASDGNPEDCGINVDLGEFNIERHNKGDGWGWAARAYATTKCTLWFFYVPPYSGELTVEPQIQYKGTVVASAHDHSYTSTRATVRMKMHFDLFQHYWDGEQVDTIIDEHHTNSSAAFWVDEVRSMSKSLSVSGGRGVFIKLTLSLYVVAHSSHASVDLNFRTGSDRRIRVERIGIHLDSPYDLVAAPPNQGLFQQ